MTRLPIPEVKKNEPVPMKYRKALADEIENYRGTFDLGTCIIVADAVSRIIEKVAPKDEHTSKQENHDRFIDWVLKTWTYCFKPPHSLNDIFWLSYQFDDEAALLNRSIHTLRYEWRATALSLFVHMLKDKDYELKY